MPDNSTSWVLNFIDKVTGPVKKMMNTISGATKSFKKMGTESSESTADIRIKLDDAKESLKDLRKELRSAEKGLSELGKLMEDTPKGKVRDQFKKQFEEQTAKVDELKAKIKETTEEIDKFGNALKNAERKGMSTVEIKVKIDDAKEALKDLRKELRSAEKGLSELGKLMENTPKGKVRDQFKKQFEEQTAKVDELKAKIKETTEEIDTFGDALQKAERKGTSSFTKLIVLVNQSSEIISKLTRSLQFTVDYKQQANEIQRLTDLTGDALADYTKKSREIADVYGEDALKVAKSVHAMQRQFGGSYEDNFKLLEEGFQRGANLSGSLLSNMERYSGTFADMGISAEQTMAIMAKAEKEGFDGNKAVEAIRKAGDAIAEMGPRQKKALEGIGISIEDLAGKTRWEAVRMVSEAMKGMTEQAKQTTIARVFGEAGKESGIQFVQNLAEEIPDLSKLPAVEESASGFKRFFSNLNSWAGETFGNIGTYANEFAPFVQVIAGAIPVIDMLRKSQWALNIAMYANPIGIIIGVLVAYIAIIYKVIQRYEQWGAALTIVMGPMGVLINALKSIYDHWESIKKAFTTGGIEAGLKRIGHVLGNAILRPIEQALEYAAMIPGLGWAKSALEKVHNFRNAHDLVTVDEKAARRERKYGYDPMQVFRDVANPNGLNTVLARGAVSGLTFNDDDDDEDGTKSTKTSGGKSGTGMSISGKGMAANIRMTINNYFNVASGVNMRKLSDEVAGAIGDRLEDAIVSLG